VPKSLHLPLATDKLCVAAARRTLQARAQRPQPNHLVNLDGLTNAFYFGWTNGLELEISLDQFTRRFAHHYRAGSRDRLHPRSEVRRVPDRRVLGVRITGLERAHYHLAGVYTDTNFDRYSAALEESVTVAANLLLHTERRMKRALRMVLVCDGSAE
jgi:hypothetical protein